MVSREANQLIVTAPVGGTFGVVWAAPDVPVVAAGAVVAAPAAVVAAGAVVAAAPLVVAAGALVAAVVAAPEAAVAAGAGVLVALPPQAARIAVPADTAAPSRKFRRLSDFLMISRCFTSGAPLSASSTLTTLHYWLRAYAGVYLLVMQ